MSDLVGDGGVLIAGGGPVGLVAALGLARRGIPVTVAGDAAHATNPTSGFGLVGGCTTPIS